MIASWRCDRHQWVNLLMNWDTRGATWKVPFPLLLPLITLCFPLQHHVFAMTLCHAALSWSQSIMNINFYKWWAKINLSPLRLTSFRYCVLVTRRVVKTFTKTHSNDSIFLLWPLLSVVWATSSVSSGPDLNFLAATLQDYKVGSALLYFRASSASKRSRWSHKLKYAVYALLRIY